MNLVKIFSAGCLVLIASNSLFAQGARKVSFRTLCLERVNDIGAVLLPGEGGQAQKIELFTDISPVIQGVFKTADAEFFVEKGLGPDGKPKRELVCKAPLAKSDRQLFIFSRGEKGEGKSEYQVHAYDDDTKSFPMGYVRVVNIAPVPVRFTLSGDVTPQVPPGKFAQFPHPKKVNDYNMYPVVVQFLSGNGVWVNGQSVSWKATERVRNVVITSIEPRYKQPAVQMFSDDPPWLEAVPGTPAAR